MTSHGILAALRERGVEVFVADGRLRYRAPAGAFDDDLRRAAADHRDDLLALLTWDATAADAELRQALSATDAALSAPCPTPAQRGALAAMRAVVEAWYADRDPLLFGAAVWIEAHVRRWRSETGGAR